MKAKIGCALLLCLMGYGAGAMAGGNMAGSIESDSIDSVISDSGIASSQCYKADDDVYVACNGISPQELNSAQGGMLGFSFTAMAGGCVLDNVTGLMWELKTADGGLRDWNKTYTNFDSTSSAQKMDGPAYVNPTQAEIDAATNTIGYVAAVNATNLCGFSDWRLPTADELKSIVDYGVIAFVPTIDTIWFPKTPGWEYWSSSPDTSSSFAAWVVGYYGAGIDENGRDASNRVRLVRAGQ